MEAITDIITRELVGLLLRVFLTYFLSEFCPYVKMFVHHIQNSTSKYSRICIEDILYNFP
jgi:hypothetical protein